MAPPSLRPAATICLVLLSATPILLTICSPDEWQLAAFKSSEEGILQYLQPRNVPISLVGVPLVIGDEPEKKQQAEEASATDHLQGQRKSDDLFMDRLDSLLPSHDNTTRLFPRDVAEIEAKLLRFNVPRNTYVQFVDSEYISIQFYRWLFAVQEKAMPKNGGDGSMGSSESAPMCPRCHLHFGTWAGPKGADWQGAKTDAFRRNGLPAGKAPDAVVDLACPGSSVRAMAAATGNGNRTEPVLIGGCGESQDGSGSGYYHPETGGRRHFDYHSGFWDMGDRSPFQTTYAHLHLSPDGRFGFPPLWNVTDLVGLLLRDPPPRDREGTDHPEHATFIHSNCGGQSGRGNLLSRIVSQYSPGGGGASSDTSIEVARYGRCHNNIARPPWIKPFDGLPCKQRPREFFFHEDCEATRDGVKTVLASLHNFTFALENTLSADYYTEKRWQALLAGSVPIVWDNHNSMDLLPDPDAALVVPTMRGGGMEETARVVARRLKHYEENGTAYQAFFRWKKRGLTVPFVRKLFLSNDYLVCRICEHIVHNPKKEPH